MKLSLPLNFLHWTQKIELVLMSIVLVLLLVLSSQLSFFFHKYQDTFYPGVTIDGVMVSGRTKGEVHAFFDEENQKLHQQVVTLQAGDKHIASTAAQLGINKNYDAAIETAYNLGRSESLPSRVWQMIAVSPPPKPVAVTMTVDENSVGQMIFALKQQADLLGEEPNALLQTNKHGTNILVNAGRTGQAIDPDQTKTALFTAVSQGQWTISAIMTASEQQLTEAQISAAQGRAQKYIGKQLILHADDQQVVLHDKDLVALLTFPDGLSKTQVFMLQTRLRNTFNRPTQETVFEYDPQTLHVKKFTPPQVGITIQEDKFTPILQSAMTSLENSAQTSADLPIPITVQNPQHTLAETNTLGITQRIGFGESRYLHSIPGRIHNVALTAERVNNTIVKPGEEFSFNKTLGDVSAATGFAPAYVIRNGRTELGDGGGVCQVSTTLFRALLNGGLPITKRHAHSYRVSYYELNSKPGVDATVYGGDVDLRFINDTGHDILIHTQTDSKNLYMKVELYGTSDGRTAEIVDHKVWDISPAPPPLYQSDPTLPHGVIKQVDFAATGAKASFTNVVKDKNGGIIRQDTYFSNYQPWRAVYLRGI